MTKITKALLQPPKYPPRKTTGIFSKAPKKLLK